MSLVHTCVFANHIIISFLVEQVFQKLTIKNWLCYSFNLKTYEIHSMLKE